MFGNQHLKTVKISMPENLFPFNYCEQGQIGDCWLVAVLDTVNFRWQHLLRSILTRESATRFKVRISGTDYEVDDMFPVMGNLYSGINPLSAPYAALIEKAVAMHFACNQTHFNITKRTNACVALGGVNLLDLHEGTIEQIVPLLFGNQLKIIHTTMQHTKHTDGIMRMSRVMDQPHISVLKDTDDFLLQGSAVCILRPNFTPSWQPVSPIVRWYNSCHAVSR
jgi:hypothetical protein